MTTTERGRGQARSTPRPGGEVRPLVTPEGVDLELVLADASERAAAFLIDAAIIVGVLVGASLILIMAGLVIRQPIFTQLIMITWLLGFFLLRNLYFVGFELRIGAATPGKRLLGLRVASRRGDALSADAVFARNALREIEVYLPLSFLIANRGGVDGLIVAAGLIWTGVFALFPLFNRDRLRAGDLVAGTWVVRTPKRGLSVELSGRSGARRGLFPFSSRQLDAYGVKELQVLEDVLRRNNARTIADVAARIRTKIAWTRAPGESDWDFLDAYYTGLREHLETRLLFGRRRRDKHDRDA